MLSEQPIWTIDALSAQAALALSVEYEGAPNGRVRDVPDRRTIRYYTTLGLIDRPAEMRGRTGLYGRRHLLQLVTIKRLQTRGLSLVEIQKHLLGLTDAELERLAKLPADLETVLATPSAMPDGPVPERSPDAFWRAVPAPPSESGAADQEGHDEQGLAVPLQGVRLGDDAILLLASPRGIDEEDIQAIQAAAAPLLKLLQTRRLLRPRQERGNR